MEFGKRSYVTTHSGLSLPLNENSTIASSIRTNQNISNIPNGERVVEVREMPTIEVSRKTHSEDKVSYQNLPSKEIINPGSVVQQLRDVPVTREQVEIEEIYQDKVIEYIVEKPVANIVYIDVPVERIVEKTIKKTIEREVITDIEIEKPVEVIIEVPVPKVVKKPVQKTITRSVSRDVVVENVVQKRIPNIIERKVEVERIQEKYIEVDEDDVRKFKDARVLPTRVDIYEQEVIKEVPKNVKNYIERPVVRVEEEVVYKKVPRIVEKVVDEVHHQEVVHQRDVHVDVDVPVEHVTYNKIEHIVEVPEYVDNVIVHDVIVEQNVEKIIVQKVDKVEKREVVHDQIEYYDVEEIVKQEKIVNRENVRNVNKYVDKPIYHDVEVIVEKVRNVEVPVIYETLIPVEKPEIIIEEVEVPIEVEVEKHIERIVEKKVNKYIDREVVIEVPEEQIEYVDKIVNVEIKQTIEEPEIEYVDVIKEVKMERLIEHKVEKIIEKTVEVPVERIVEKIVKIKKEKPVFINEYVERPVYVDVNVHQPKTTFMEEEKDDQLEAVLKKQQEEIQTIKSTIAGFKGRIKIVRENISCKDKTITRINYGSQNAALTRRIQELKESIEMVKKGVIRKSLYQVKAEDILK